MGQSCRGTSRLFPAESTIGQSFLGTKQAILLLIKNRKIYEEKLVSITPHVSQPHLRESCQDTALHRLIAHSASLRK